MWHVFIYRLTWDGEICPKKTSSICTCVYNIYHTVVLIHSIMSNHSLVPRLFHMERGNEPGDEAT